MTTISKVDTSNIFAITQKGDRKILEAHENAIIFVGLTRVGKSTAFNWVLNKPMVGKGNLNSHYVNQIEKDADVAAVGASFASVTLAPNIYKDYEADLSLVDMAGYEDTRNYVGVIGVSYFLKALFERVRKVKFVIVFDENKFKEQACGGLIKTFKGFINMFHFEHMTPQIKQKLKQSLSLVITRAERPEEHYGYITEILDNMKDGAFLFDHKDLIIELLEYLKDSARIQPFKKARNDQPPEKCQFIERFNKLKWSFFDLDECQKQVGQSLISLPFTKDFQKLAADQKDTFDKELKNKIANYLNYAQIIKRLIENFVGNWIDFLQMWRTDRKANLSSFKLNQLFEQIRRFLKYNDVYNLDEIVSVELKVNYQPPSLIQAIKSILALEEIVTVASSIQDFETVKVKIVDSISGEQYEEERMVNLTFKDVMEKFKGLFAQMIKIIKNFASSQDEELLLEKTNFVLKRGFRQFQKLYELDSQLIHDIKIKLTGNCNSVFEGSGRIPWGLEFRQKFVKNLDQALLTKIFPSIEALHEYEAFFKAYADERLKQAQKESKQEEDRCNIFFSDHKNIIETAKADLLLGLMEKEKACLCYINALVNIISLYKCVNDSALYQNNKDEQLDKLSMRKLKLIKKVVAVLKSIDSETDRHKNYALQLALHHNMIEQTCNIYQLLIKNATAKSQLYKKYAQFCLEWGRIEEATIVLQKKLSVEQDSFQNYNNTVNELRDVQTNRETYLNNYSENLRKLGRLSINDAQLDTMLKSITQDVQRLINILDKKKELAKE